MATEGTPFRDRYASEARAAAARAHAPPVEEPPTPVPRRVHALVVARAARGRADPDADAAVQITAALPRQRGDEDAGGARGPALEAEVRAGHARWSSRSRAPTAAARRRARTRRTTGGGACGTTAILRALRAASTRRQKRCGAREPRARARTKRTLCRWRSSSSRGTSRNTSRRLLEFSRTRRPCSRGGWRRASNRQLRRVLRSSRTTRARGRTAAQAPDAAARCCAPRGRVGRRTTRRDARPRRRAASKNHRRRRGARATAGDRSFCKVKTQPPRHRRVTPPRAPGTARAASPPPRPGTATQPRPSTSPPPPAPPGNPNRHLTQRLDVGLGPLQPLCSIDSLGLCDGATFIQSDASREIFARAVVIVVLHGPLRGLLRRVPSRFKVAAKAEADSKRIGRSLATRPASAKSRDASPTFRMTSSSTPNEASRCSICFFAEADLPDVRADARAHQHAQGARVKKLPTNAPVTAPPRPWSTSTGVFAALARIRLASS